MRRLLARKLLPHQQGLAYDACLVRPRPPRTRSESAGLAPVAAPVRPGRVNGRHSGWGRRLTSTTKCWTAPSARVGRVRVGQACSVKHSALVRDCVHAETLPLRSTLGDNGNPFPATHAACRAAALGDAHLTRHDASYRHHAQSNNTRLTAMISMPAKMHLVVIWLPASY